MSFRAITTAVLLPFVALLCLAGWFDARQRRIPNRLVVTGTLLAFAAHGLLPAGSGFLVPLDAAAGGLGLLAAGAGLLIAAAALLPLYALGAMGAGDVKLMAMLGAFLGPEHIGGALLFSLLAGSLMGLTLLLIHRRRGGTLPFGVAIAAGTFAYLGTVWVRGSGGVIA